jgi:hypothetical protein
MLLVNVPYLEAADLNADGTLTAPTRELLALGDKLLVVMIKSAEGCGYCTRAVPEFQKLSQLPDSMVRTAAIEIRNTVVTADGQTKGPVPHDVLQTFTGNAFVGVPSYVVVVGAHRVMYHGERTAQAILSFCSTLPTPGQKADQ